MPVAVDIRYRETEDKKYEICIFIIKNFVNISSITFNENYYKFRENVFAEKLHNYAKILIFAS